MSLNYDLPSKAYGARYDPRNTSVEFLVSEPTAFLYFHVPADTLQSFSRSAKVIVRVYRFIHRRAGRSRQRRTDRCAPRRYAAYVARVPHYLPLQRMTDDIYYSYIFINL